MALNATQMMNQALQTGGLDRIRGEAFTEQQSVKAITDSGIANGVHFVVEEDPTQSLMDSMEELSMNFEEKEMKSVGDRKLGEKLSSRQKYITAVEKWQKTMPDMPGGEFCERMLRGLRQMRKGGQLPNTKEFLGQLAQGSKDPSHQYAMLEILAALAEAGDKDILKLIADTRDHLLKTKGAEIKAGVNLAEAVNARTKDPQEMQELRDLYRAEVVGFRTPQECFKSLLASRGPGGLQASIDFLVEGAGVDLNSPSPSREPAELRRILLDLQCVEVLKTVYDRAADFGKRLRLQFGEKMQLDQEAFTGRVMDMTRMPFSTKESVGDFIRDCGVKALPARLDFCREFQGLVRELSPRLFTNEDDRISVVNAAQELMDDLVAEMEDAKEVVG